MTERIAIDYIADCLKDVEVDYSKFKYNPHDFPYPLNQDMEKFYRAIEANRTEYIELYLGDLHLTIKQAAVVHYFSDAEAIELQKYFWGFLE